jgi:hypothetical protein
MPYVHFKKLKERVSLAQILEHYALRESLAETSTGYEGVCPICDSNAFKVNTEKNAWYCFGECRSKEARNGGNILDFVARMEGVSYKEAAEMIAEWCPEHPVEPTTDAESGDDTEGQGDTQVSPEDETADTDDSVEPISSLTENKPLKFTLKGVDPEHTEIGRAGINPVLAKRYGVGYFGGKGMMHNRIVFPFHNEEGEVLAYAGYSPKDGSWKYPPPDKFNPSIEVYGIDEALQQPDVSEKTVRVLCRDPLEALRERSKQMHRVCVAVTTPKLSPEQLHLLDMIMPIDDGLDGKLEFRAPWNDQSVPEFLLHLLPRYYVRLERY